MAAYQRAVSLFSTALDALQKARGTVSQAEYQRMRGYVEQSRLFSEQARIDLERHIQEHGCRDI